MNIRATLESYSKSSEMMEPRNGSLDYPSIDAEPTSMRFVSLRDVRLNATTSQCVSVFFRIVAPVGVQANGSFSRATPTAFDRRNTVDHRLQRRGIVRIGGGQANAQRNASTVGYNMMLASFFGPVHGAFPGFFPHRPQREPCWNPERLSTNRCGAPLGAWPGGLQKSFATLRPFANPEADASRSSRFPSRVPPACTPRGARSSG